MTSFLIIAAMNALLRYKICSAQPVPVIKVADEYEVCQPSILYSVVDTLDNNKVIHSYSDYSADHHQVLLSEIYVLHRSLNQEFLDYHVCVLEFLHEL